MLWLLAGVAVVAAVLGWVRALNNDNAVGNSGTQGIFKPEFGGGVTYQRGGYCKGPCRICDKERHAQTTNK